ncbi:MAG: hypothetical protein WA364_24140 [Candidatus Nitrosopolaris sp.]
MISPKYCTVLSKAIQDATQQLAMLNMVNEEQKQAIATLVDLQKASMTEYEIRKLVTLVGRWNATRPGLDQGNGGVLDDKLIDIRH